MSREFEPKVPTQMFHAGCNAYMAIGKAVNVQALDNAVRAMLAHPDFRAQLRAWAAEEMRGLVAQPPDRVPVGKDYFDGGHNACRAETLANIERWEKANENE